MNDYTLLIGENNAGKSNILRALRVFYEHDLKYDAKLDYPKYVSEDEESWIEIEYLTTEDEQDSLKEEYRSEDKILKVRKILKTVDKNFSDKIDSKQSNIFAYENNVLSTNYFYGAQNVSLSKLGKIIYIPELSKVDDNLKLSGPSPLREMITYVMKKVVEKSDSFNNLSSAFQEFNSKFKHEKSDELSINSFENDVNDELGNWNIKFGLNVNPIQASEIIKNLVTHYIYDLELNNNVAIDAFGQGLQRHLIYTLLKLSAKYSEPKKSKKKEFAPELTLILFEEPELFLHPSQQEILNINLREMASVDDQQILITTHSPVFVSRNFDQITSIVRLVKDGDTKIYQINKDKICEIHDFNKSLHKVFYDILNDPNSDDSLKKEIRSKNLAREDDDLQSRLEQEKFKYFLWMDSERTSLLFAKKVLICEGATEKIFIDYMLNTCWMDIKQKNVYILDCMGKFNIHRFMKLLNELGIKHSVLMDKDNKDIQNIVNDFIENNKTAITDKICYFNNDLEDFLGLAKPRPDLKPLNVMMSYDSGLIVKERIEELHNLILTLL
ncbi:MAG: AAA family ATPase [Seleniivibrio sp.]|nr:AAA family ATPase [Seleniivibrio sp.]